MFFALCISLDYISNFKAIYLILNPPLTIYDTENRALPQKLTDKLQISRKRWVSGYCCWKLRKWKVKHQKQFRNYLRRLARALGTIRASRATAIEDLFIRKLTKSKNYTYLEILVPYLNNISEETIFGSNKQKLCAETLKTLINELNRLGSA